MGFTLVKYKIIIFSFLFVSGCAPKTAYVVKQKGENKNISNDFGSADEAVLKMISPYKSQLDKTMNVVIGELTESMEKSRPNSSLSNFMCDAMVSIGKIKFPEKNIQFGVMNYGGIRLPSLPKGPVTISRMYELMPFDNTLVIMNVDKETVRQLCDRIIALGGWPVSKELKLEANGLILKNILINNIPLDQMPDNFNIALPNYVAEGGDNTNMLKNRPKEDSGIFIRDILQEYVKINKIITPDTIKRIIINP
jgi:2',3'-cyclic-nucleotide 2'-phosphodiesterase (5'-nucleotidase family)